MKNISEIYDDIQANLTDENSVEHHIACYLLNTAHPTPADFYQYYGDLFDTIDERSKGDLHTTVVHNETCKQITNRILIERNKEYKFAVRCAAVGNHVGATSIYRWVTKVDEFMDGRWRKVKGKVQGIVRTREAIVAIDEVLPKIRFDEKGRYSRKVREDFAGISCKVSSLRLHTFQAKGCTCVECGLEASYFAIERNLNNSTSQLELYGVIDHDGDYEEVMFTKDHIQPKSLGGKDHIDNMQTMCIKCNVAKGNTKAGEPNIAGGVDAN